MNFAQTFREKQRWALTINLMRVIVGHAACWLLTPCNSWWPQRTRRMMMLLFIYSPPLAATPPRFLSYRPQDIPELRSARDPKHFLMCQLPLVAKKRGPEKRKMTRTSTTSAAETEAKQIWPTHAWADKKTTIKLFNALLDATVGLCWYTHWVEKQGYIYYDLWLN